MTTLDFVEKENYEKGFKEYYDKNLKEIFNKLEDDRHNTLEILIKVTGGIISSFGSVVLILYLCFDNFSILRVFNEIFIARKSVYTYIAYVIYGHVIISMAIIYIIVLNYRLKLEQKVLPVLFKFYDGNWSFEIGNAVSKELIKESNIYGTNFDAEFRNYIKGQYKGINIQIAEGTIIAHKQNILSENFLRTYQKKTYIFSKCFDILEIFKGILVVIDFNKNFKGKTTVYRKTFFRKKYEDFKKINYMKNVELEDPSFNSFYHVTSDDQIESRYILTPSFMERLVKISDDFCKAKRIECSFYHNKLFLSIPCKKYLFNAGSILKETSTDDLHLILAHINMIFNIIDELKLYQKIAL